MGANAKAKANAATAIPELIQIAKNPSYQENRKEKHDKDAKLGWYRYDVRFAIPVYENDVLVRYNVFGARLLINHAENGKKYLYDILTIKKEQATTISVVKTHFLFKIVARSCLIVKNCVKIMVNKGILGCKNLRQRINREEFW